MSDIWASSKAVRSLFGLKVMYRHWRRIRLRRSKRLHRKYPVSKAWGYNEWNSRQGQKWGDAFANRMRMPSLLRWV